jgi:tetratricopeptide (TPR) repeat protein
VNDHSEPVGHYAAVLDAWVRGDHSSSTALQLLTARDDVAYAFEHKDTPSPRALEQVAQLDLQLRSVLPQVHAAAGAQISDWREARLPPATAWWWPPSPAGETTSDLIWTIATTLIIAAAAALTADVARRLLAPGIDFLGAFITMILVILVLFAANALTARGRRAIGRVAGMFGMDSDIADDLLKLFQRGIDRVLPRMGVRRGYEQGARLALALAALLLIFGLSRLLPLTARYYNNRGIDEQARGALTRAVASFQRAISADPDFAVGHYNLANAYEESLEYDAAIKEYMTAIQGRPDLYFAYNNLARIYLLRRNDPASALELLRKAQALNPSDVEVRYSLAKNQGWAHLRLNLPHLAESDLRQALALKADGGAAHCLLAQAQEMMRETPVASWEQCAAYNADRDVEAEWDAVAQERLAEGAAQ